MLSVTFCIMIIRETAVALIKAEYERLDGICGVDTGGLEIRLSSRMTRKLGCFEVKPCGVFKRPVLSVSISERILTDEELFYDVIRHEYAHAVVYIRYPKERHCHDKTWKDICLKIGCSPKATVKDISGEIIKSRPYKYIVKCSICGAESKFKSESKVVKILLHKKRGQVVCRKCKGSEFDLQFYS